MAELKTISENLNESGSAYLKGYIYDDEFTRPAVIVCPGGGYMFLTPHEGEPTAMAYYAKGYNVFICYYPIRDEAVYPAPQLAVLNAVKLVRSNAELWKVCPDAITVAGFSAGAHVAACAGTLYHDSELMERLKTESSVVRPDAMLLIYPCIGIDIPGYEKGKNDKNVLRCDELVDRDTPPAFIVTSFGDKFVSCNQSLNFARALSDNDVPFELHCFEPGDHGMLNGDDRYLSEYTTRDLGAKCWFNLSIEWLRDRYNTEVGFGRNLSVEGRSHQDYFSISQMG